MIFFVNIPIGLAGLYHGLSATCRIIARSRRIRWMLAGLLLFGSGIGLLSYVLEVFGEHTLERGAKCWRCWRVSALLLAGYGFRAARTKFPLLRLSLFRIRTFRAAVSGSFFTRLGIGGIPFLFPLLYQVGLGFTPIQSGLLLMPQAIAAMSLKLTMPRILARVGYRGVLISNTVILGLLIILFATIGVGTPVWLIVLQAFCFGFFTSLQYTSMNTLVYADVTPRPGQQRQHHRQHDAADVDQFRRGDGVAGHGVLHSRPLPFECPGNDPRHSRGIPGPRRPDDSFDPDFRGIEERRR